MCVHLCFTSVSAARRCSSAVSGEEIVLQISSRSERELESEASGGWRCSDPPVRWSCVQPAAELLVITAAESNSAGETFSFFVLFFSCGYKLVLLLHLKHHLLHIAASHGGSF